MAEQTPLHDLTVKAGAVLVEEGGYLVPDHYGDPAREYEQVRSHCGLFDLSHRAKVELTGSEASAFLHNLCTNDIMNLALGAGCEAFLTTNKAKVVAHMIVYHVRLHDGSDALWLDLAPGLAEKIIQHLDHYVISEQVEFADRTREFAHLHLAGPQATQVLERALVDDVPELDELQHMIRTFGANDTAHVRRHSPLGVPGYDIVCLKARAQNIWKMIQRAGAKPAGLQTWQTLRVEAGLPVQGVDLDENTFAPEVGRTAQAICYTKGCYLGQEPVVMARDRGQINRTLLGLRLSSGPVQRGTLVYREGKEVGRVTSSVQSPLVGTGIALGYLRRGNWDAGTTVEVDVAGQRQGAVVTTLPFTGACS